MSHCLSLWIYFYSLLRICYLQFTEPAAVPDSIAGLRWLDFSMQAALLDVYSLPDSVFTYNFMAVSTNPMNCLN